jgi:hypothetical protein
MRDLVWDRPSLARRYRDRNRSRVYVPHELRDLDDDTELAFHKVWLAGELQALPDPEPREPVELPIVHAEAVVHDIDGLRSACGLNPLPRRRPQRRSA